MTVTVSGRTGVHSLRELEHWGWMFTLWRLELFTFWRLELFTLRNPKELVG